MQPAMLATPRRTWQSPSPSPFIRRMAVHKLPVCWALAMLLCAFVNALLFTYSATTPLVASDSWYYLDTFIREYFNYSLDFRDFFDKRAGGDHAQPVQKLILLFHLRNFGLDFTVEALFGVAFALLGCVLAMRLAMTAPAAVADTAKRARRPLASLGYAACLGAIPLLTFSLNSTEVFTWSLVTLGFMLLALGIGYFGIGGKAIVGDWPAWLLLPATFLLAVVLDDLGLVYTLALAIIAALHALANRRFRQAGMVAAFALAGLLAYELVVQPLLSPRGTATTDTSGIALGWFIAHGGEAWKAIWIPFTSMFVHATHLQHGSVSLQAMQAMLAVACIVLHVLFWLRLPARLRAGQRLDMVCAALLLSFYGSVAAIVALRVPTFGFDYLQQPRYNVPYLLGALPILISGAFAWRSALPHATLERVYLGGALLLAVGASLVQWPLASKGWDSVKYISEYTQKAAFQLGALRKAPESVHACANILFVCGYDPAKKRELIQLLDQHQLNIFNRAFQLRHRLYPDAADVPTDVPTTTPTEVPADVPAATPAH